MRRVAAWMLMVAAACGSRPPVIVRFAPDKESANAGDPVQLSWDVRGATSITLAPGTDVTASTSATVAAQPGATTYTLTARNSVGQVTATTQVTGLSTLQIAAFSATPAQVDPGGTVHLSWYVPGATALSLSCSSCPAGTAGLGSQPADSRGAAISLQTTATFTLSATGKDAQGAAASAQAQALARVLPAPSVTLHSDATALSQGQTAHLSWTGAGAQGYSVVAQTTDASGTHTATSAMGPLLSLAVQPQVTTIYTVLAAGPRLTATSNPIQINVTPNPGTQLGYVAPPSGSELLRLMQNSALSTSSVMVLELVAAQSLTARGLALDLPLDASKVAFDAAQAGDVPGSPGLVVNPAALDPGLNPTGCTAVPAAAARLGSANLANVLALGVSLKPAGCGAHTGSASIAAGTWIARLRLSLLPVGGKGTVFDGTAGPSGLGPLFRAFVGVPDPAAGSSSQNQPASFAIGKLTAQ